MADPPPKDPGQFRSDDASAYIGSLLAHAPVGLGFLDRQLRYLAVNEALATINGITPAAHVGRTVADVIPDFAPMLEPLLRGVLDTGVPVLNLDVTNRPLTPDAARHWLCNYFPLHGNDGTIQGVGALVVEITDLRRSHEAARIAEDALAASEVRHRGLLEAMPDLVFRLDGEARHLDFYAPSADRLYAPAEGIIGRVVRDVLPAAAASAYEEAIARVLASGEAVEFQYELTFPTGDVHLYDARMVPATAREVLTLVRDVTAQRQLEERLRETQQQLLHAQKLEAIGQLAGGVAHDFNNLLMVISGNAELLRARMTADSDALVYSNQILQATETAAQLTRQLLAFGRRQHLAPEVLAPGEVARAMERLLRRTIREDIVLEIAVTDTGAVRADRSQLEQVLLNLVANARDAMPGGGRLSIEIGPGEPPGEFVRLTVRDTGEGMDDDVRAHLFEPFFTTKPQGKGTGLGLSTVHGIVKQSGGHIRVESAPGAGTAMHVFLSRVEVEAPHQEPDTRGQALALPPGEGTVLLVEDNDGVRRLASSILKRCGYSVVEAKNGAAALSLIDQRQHQDIRLVLTDIVMPGMSGRDLAEHVRRVSPRTAILFMSGYPGDVVGSGGQLRYPMLPKPFTPTQLAHAAKAAIESAG